MNAGLPRILAKKKTGIIDIMVFIIKYCLLLDTSELFVSEKMSLNNEIKNNNDCSEGFDLIDFFTEDLSANNNMFFIGGSGNAPAEAPAEAAPVTEKKNNNGPPATANNKKEKKKDEKPMSEKEKQRILDSEEKLRNEEELEKNADNELKKEEEQKNEIEKTVKNNVDSKLNNSVSIDTGKTGEESVGGDLIKLITDTMKEGSVTVSRKVKAFCMVFIYASVYPAVPFFAVMAAMFATLKYLFFKFRVF